MQSIHFVVVVVCCYRLRVVMVDVNKASKERPSIQEGILMWEEEGPSITNMMGCGDGGMRMELCEGNMV